jgi:hypothetical protein
LTDLLAAQVRQVVEDYAKRNGLTQADVLEVARVVIGMPTAKRPKTSSLSDHPTGVADLLDETLPSIAEESLDNKAAMEKPEEVHGEGNMEA